MCLEVCSPDKIADIHCLQIIPLNINELAVYIYTSRTPLYNAHAPNHIYVHLCMLIDRMSICPTVYTAGPVLN